MLVIYLLIGKFLTLQAAKVEKISTPAYTRLGIIDSLTFKSGILFIFTDQTDNYVFYGTRN